MFGYAKVINSEESEKLEKKYGPTPFHKDLNPEKLLTILKSRKTQIKRALLEQDLISGLGNIYANDSLWLSNIHPERITHSITIKEAEKLLEAMKTILSEGIEHRGSTLDDKMYVDIYGKEGSHQNHFRVYGKALKPCPKCGSKIKGIVVAQRSTFYCPQCQV
jgi:formamidopyrimidine-DNA glycosylase